MGLKNAIAGHQVGNGDLEDRLDEPLMRHSVNTTLASIANSNLYYCTRPNQVTCVVISLGDNYM